MKPIGVVQSCYKQKFATPRQSGLIDEAKGFVKLIPEVQAELSLQGLQQFSHVWLIFLFHQNTNQKFRPKVHPPRLQKVGVKESVGVFASRSPHRPNPIGLSLVKLESVEPDGIWISGIDVIEGTPVLDIKPYLPEVESVAEASDGWLSKAPWQVLEVKISDEVSEQIQFHAERLSEPELKSLIVNSLKQDPRPQVYKDGDISEQPYKKGYGFKLYDLDVQFEVLSENTINVTGIEL